MNQFQNQAINPEHIDLNPDADAFVIGNIKTHEFLFVVGAVFVSLFLFGTIGFIPIIFRIFVFVFPVLVGLFFQMDMPRKIKIKKVFNGRNKEINPGDQITGGYDLTEFETAKNYIIEDGFTIVFASLILPPMALYTEREKDRLTHGLTAAIRTTAQSGAAFEYYFFHRNFVPMEVQLDQEHLKNRERYWMETGTMRYSTEIFIRLIFPYEDVAKAEMYANRIRRAYMTSGGMGQWIWSSAALAGQESHDNLNPGALRHRYMDMFKDRRVKR